MPSRSIIKYDGQNEPFDFFTFRNEHSIHIVIIQMFLLFAGFVVIVGVIYVIFLILLIFFHHIIYDRDPHRIPSYVKNSAQFSSDEDEDDDPHFIPDSDDKEKKKISDTRSDAPLGKDDEMFPHSRGPTALKKAQIMDKFMTDLDHTRKMKQNFRQDEY